MYSAIVIAISIALVDYCQSVATPSMNPYPVARNDLVAMGYGNKGEAQGDGV